jgi:hypothetical protein
MRRWQDDIKRFAALGADFQKSIHSLSINSAK